MLVRVALILAAILAISSLTLLYSRIAATRSHYEVGQGEDRDWANIARYRDANRPLIAKTDARRVVFMGDSITDRWAEQPFLKQDAHFVGRGISGQTASQMLVRFRSDVVALRPAIVHIMAGTNDVGQNAGPETSEEITGYITAMVEIAQANGIRVVLTSIPPSLRLAWQDGVGPEQRIRALNAELKAYAARKHIVFVDYWPVLATPAGGMKAEYSSDDLHPNAKAYAAMAPLTRSAIERAMPER